MFAGKMLAYGIFSLVQPWSNLQEPNLKPSLGAINTNPNISDDGDTGGKQTQAQTNKPKTCNQTKSRLLIKSLTIKASNLRHHTKIIQTPREMAEATTKHLVDVVELVLPARVEEPTPTIKKRNLQQQKKLTQLKSKPLVFFV